MGLLTLLIGIIDLLLDRTLVPLKVLKLPLIICSLVLVADLLVFEHGNIDLGVLLDFSLNAVLLLSHLLAALFVQIGGFDLGL